MNAHILVYLGIFEEPESIPTNTTADDRPLVMLLLCLLIIIDKQSLYAIK